MKRIIKCSGENSFLISCPILPEVKKKKKPKTNPQSTVAIKGEIIVCMCVHFKKGNEVFFLFGFFFFISLSVLFDVYEECLQRALLCSLLLLLKTTDKTECINCAKHDV